VSPQRAALPVSCVGGEPRRSPVRPIRMRRLLLLTSLTALVAALAACGPEDHSAAQGDPPATGQVTTGPFDGLLLTEDLGCGFGFSVANEEADVLLSLHLDPDATGRARRTYELPDRAWEAEVRVGTDLDANWCTDVIEEPQAVVEETWRIVGGTLTFAGELPPFRWTEDWQVDNPVRAALTDVVVESADGDRAELGDVQLANTAWGLLPG
jgi:hypothetical protein